MGTPLKLDEIGPWSEIKLEIIKKYAKAYTTILSRKKLRFNYIDAFAGAGLHKLKKTDEFIPGSPLNALFVKPPFNHYYFIDLDEKKTESLKKIVGNNKNVTISSGDCNVVLLEEIFPTIKYEDYKRALCLLDPYGLHLNWEVLQTAGQMKSIEIFLNFPINDMQRNVFLSNPEKITPAQKERMNKFWGNEYWYKIIYHTDGNLFEFKEKFKETEMLIVNAFKKRLKEVAGFLNVPDPIPMRNTMNATVYYLFFASQKPVAMKIVRDIFNKYRS